MGDVQQQQQQLEARRNELRDRLERIGRDLRTPLDTDLDEQALQVQNRDQLLEIQRVTRQELARTEEQLSRLEREQGKGPRLH
ncbi:MAG TPA: hypothetical protein VKZ99_07840 [Gammaproteobacteria bacterium]|nr:hypothetical protein [Gammaproteobacteria bacterium]